MWGSTIRCCGRTAGWIRRAELLCDRRANELGEDVNDLFETVKAFRIALGGHNWIVAYGSFFASSNQRGLALLSQAPRSPTTSAHPKARGQKCLSQAGPTGSCLVAFFQVLQPRVEDLFHAAEFGAP